MKMNFQFQDLIRKNLKKCKWIKLLVALLSLFCIQHLLNSIIARIYFKIYIYNLIKNFNKYIYSRYLANNYVGSIIARKDD